MPHSQHARVYLHEADAGAGVDEGAEEVLEGAEVEAVFEAQSGSYLADYQ